MTSGHQVSSSQPAATLPLGIALLVAGALLITLFGQYLIGPPNIHSARSLVMFVEVTIIALWLVSKPQALLVRFSPIFRVGGLSMLVAGTLGVFLSAHNWAAALVGQMEWVAHLLFLVAISDFFVKGKLPADSLLCGIVVAGLVAVFFYASRWVLMVEPRTFDWLWNAHPFLHMRHFAFLILPAFLAALYFSISEKRSLQVFGVASMAVLLAALFWAGGRASIGAAFIGVLTAFAFVIKHRLISAKKFLVQLGLVVVTAVVLAEVFAVEHGGMGLSFNHGRDGVESLDHLSSGRLSIWVSVVWNMDWYQWLIGHGVDNYRYLPGRYDETVHPHSWFFQSLSAWGLPTTLVLVGGLWLLAVRILWDLYRARSEKGFSSTVFFSALVLFCYLILSLVDGNFYHSWAIMIVLPFVAVSLVAACKISPSSEEVARLSSGWLYGVAALVVAVLVQIINVTTVFGGRVPEPGDWRAQMVLAVPFNTIFVENWLEPWQRYDQSAMLNLLRWLQQNSADGYRFMLVEVEMLSQAGYAHEAARLYQEALESAPARAKKRLIELGPPTGGS